ncbi:hypothetical protein SAMN06295912_10533 [Sphingomonas laterariae]|uniref:Uncharacterized protein n=1 Tax=Edaphosphingomonas laterariae TaxID=861865 RepID=A0A239DTE5_9SPHN|nr:hypothetical protein [Sphingomonas laterariae]SNS35617.1 hypothetical protein SAMN06295912_10533 [Sphingomonas laterariae]
MKGHLTARFFIIAVLIAVIVFIADCAFHAVLVPDMYAGYPQRAQAGMEALFPFLFLTYIVQITLYLMMFLFIYPQRGVGNALWWGVWGGLFVVLPNMQFFVAVEGTTWTLLIAQCVEAIVLLMAAGLLFELLYRPRGQAAVATA